MYSKSYVERPEAVFFSAPLIQDIAIEFGVDDAETITVMYEVFKRTSGLEKQYTVDDESYQKGLRDGYNDAIEEVASMVDDLSWEIGRLRKK